MVTLSRRELLKAACAGATCAACGNVAGALASDDRFVRDAMHWEAEPDGRVTCKLCPRRCRTAPGERGYCGVRQNEGGKYYTLVFGRAVAVHDDAIEKKPLFHVTPGRRALSIATAGCNIECKFCQNWAISQSRPEKVPARYFSPRAAVAAARSSNSVIAFTYTEPVVFYEYVYETAREGNKVGVPTVMISNGYIGEKAARQIIPELSAIKIDLKSFNRKFYRDVCNGELDGVLETLLLLSEMKLWFEIVVLLVPGMNDSEKELRAMCKWIRQELGPDVPVHFSRFHPMYKLRNLHATPVSSLERAWKLAREEGLHFAYIGNLPGHKAESTYCPKCGARLVHRLRYYISENIIVDGKCPKCGTKIPGLWDAKALSARTAR